MRSLLLLLNLQAAREALRVAQLAGVSQTQADAVSSGQTHLVRICESIGLADVLDGCPPSSLDDAVAATLRRVPC